MFYCKLCGQKLSGDSKFCTMCGSPVEPRQSTEYANDERNASESTSKESGYYYSSNQNSHSADTHSSSLQNRIAAFKNSKHPKAKLIVLILSMLLCFGSFCAGELLLGFIGLLQFGLLLWGLFIDITNRKKGRMFLRYTAVVMACLLIIPAFTVITKDSSVSVSHNDPVTTEASTPTPTATKAPEILIWPHNPLAALIPVPDSAYGSVRSSSDD